MLFWLVVLGAKFSFAYFLQVTNCLGHLILLNAADLLISDVFADYFLQIRPLVKPTQTIVDMKTVTYSWHDFVSKSELPL